MDLPTDLIPEILEFILEPADLASACLVNKVFHRFCARILYKRIAIYSWHRDVKNRTIQLFTTLAHCPNLACFVSRLIIRGFPKAISKSNSTKVVDALKNCTNLDSCAWTRDGTLNDEILEALSSCPSLRELEINGRSNYNHTMLSRFRNLEKIAIIMPSRNIVTQLESWIKLNGERLHNLTLICNMSPVVDDTILSSVASSLPNLEHLHLAGCRRVTNLGVWALLSATIQGLLSLGLERLSPTFDIRTLTTAAESCSPHPLRRLSSITLAIHPSVDSHDCLNHLLSHSPLEIFHVYPIRDFINSNEAHVTQNLWRHIVETHAKTLRRFSVHKISVYFEAIRDICEKCEHLEELFVVVRPLGTVAIRMLATSLAPAKNLRSIHINYPLSLKHVRPGRYWDMGGKELDTSLTQVEVLRILGQCSSTVTQFGCNSKVWKVSRNVIWKNGVMEVQLTLDKYEHPDVPEQFLVVRTRIDCELQGEQ